MSIRLRATVSVTHLKYMGPDVHLYGAWANTATISRVKSPFFDVGMTFAVIGYGVVLFVLVKVSCGRVRVLCHVFGTVGCLCGMRRYWPCCLIGCSWCGLVWLGSLQGREAFSIMKSALFIGSSGKKTKRA